MAIASQLIPRTTGPASRHAVGATTDEPPLRRLLIVSPHFPPINAPDLHRVRLALPHLRSCGWQAEILAVDPSRVETVHDPALHASLPSGCPVHYVPALPPSLTRPLGWGSLAARCYFFMRQAGDRLLASGRFDAVLFSTTQFGLLPLGPSWKKRHGVPYILDFQDEWISDYYRQHPSITPPGGRFKYALSQWIARRRERPVMEQTAQILSVSADYNRRLQARYPSIPHDHFHELPFGGDEADFSHALQHGPQDFFRPGPVLNWVYVGRGGRDMTHTSRALFQALRNAQSRGLISPSLLRLHFIGTNYAPREKAVETFAPLAREYGLGDLVQEITDRVPYFTALRCLRDADAILVLGSDDPSYNASKIFPCMLAGRPLLSILREESPAAAILRRADAGTVVTFSAGEIPRQTSQKIIDDWFIPRAYARPVESTSSNLAFCRASTLTRQLADILDRAVSSTPAS